MQFFRLHGLVVASAIELPLECTGHSDVVTDVMLRCGQVPAELEAPIAEGPNWTMTADRLLLKIPGVARFLIAGGREIVIESASGARLADALGFLWGSVFSILLYQRGQMALHASAVASEGRAFLFTGRSGRGKSTLAAALCNAGCDLVNDDLCVLGPDADDRLQIKPDGSRLKLWAQSLEHFGATAHADDAVRPNLQKYYHAPPRLAALDRTPPVKAIYVLRPLRPDLSEGIERLSLVDAAHVLSGQVYRRRLVVAMGKQAEQFAFVAATVARVGVYWLTFPSGLHHLAATAERLQRHWKSLPQ